MQQDSTEDHETGIKVKAATLQGQSKHIKLCANLDFKLAHMRMYTKHIVNICGKSSIMSHPLALINAY